MVILTSSAPMAKCRVLYIGSAVPLETAAGLEAVQQPLAERYPVDDESKIEGIDAYVSVTNTNIQMQYLGDSDQIIQFPISALSMCAAVRCISTVNVATGEKSAKFVSLNDPAAGGENSQRPAIFTAVTRRTQGRKVLECHGYICQSAKDALELVKCASIAGKNFKKNGGQQTPLVNGTARMNGNASPPVVRATVDTIPTAFNRLSVNSNTFTNGNAMRLIPGEPVSKITAGPEFYEPVSAQGYFYSSNKAEVKKFNIEKLGGRHDDIPSEVASEMPATSPRMVNGMDIPAAPPSEPVIPTAQPFAPQPPPIFIPFRGPHMVGGPVPPPAFARPPMYFRPPPPPPPHHMHPMMMRPRFFSPPPPRMRPQPFVLPPGAPPPMMAAPIYIRRPRQPSKSSSRSRSSSKSRDSRSRSPKPAQNGVDHTVPKVPNGDADSSSDESRIRRRPYTPPMDYNKQERQPRQSRREVYEVKYGVAPPLPSREEYETPPQRPYDYYVYPPSNGGYTPFSMYNPHGRSRSVPPHARHRSKSPGKKAKGRKHKKQKVKKGKPKKHHQHRYPQQPNGVPGGLYQRQPEPQYRRYPAAPRSDVSTESNAGYHSEIPKQKNVDTSGYEFYPPRDFRKSGRQFMNERGFGESIRNDPLLSRSTRPVPSAYDLSDANRDPPSLRGTKRNDDVDFTMY